MNIINTEINYKPHFLVRFFKILLKILKNYLPDNVYRLVAEIIHVTYKKLLRFILLIKILVLYIFLTKYELNKLK